MVSYKPSSIDVTESVPGSVATFRVTAKQAGSGAVVCTKDYPRDGDGPVFTLPLGASFFQSGDEGKQVVFYVMEIGPDGTESPESSEMNDDGVGQKIHTVTAIPDGPEGIHVNG